VNDRPGLLEIAHLHVARAGRPAIRDVSLVIERGTITALLGPNGAGKSTLVLAVGGLLEPTAGSISLSGIELAHKRPEDVRALGVAIVPEGRRILRELTVHDNLRAAATALPRSAADRAISRALQFFPELERRLAAPASDLSGGEQQMVALAQALIGSPKYILIDELSLGLAPVVVRRLVPIILEMANAGVGVLLIEQFATIALQLAASAYLLEGGVIRFAGRADELQRRPELLHSAYLSHHRLVVPVETVPTR
jgi:branched-chain amino acid transport system ATP-binding protein